MKIKGGKEIMTYRKYECKNKKSFYEFEDENNIVTVKLTSEDVKGEIIEKKTFEDWEDAKEYFYEIEEKLTKDGLITEDKLNDLRGKLEYQDEFEDFLYIDLSAIGLIDDNGSDDPILDEIGEIQTELGSISDGKNVLRFLQWAVMFDAMRKGLIASMDTAEYKKFSENKKDWMLSAREHGQLESIIAQVNNCKIKKAVSADDIFIDKDTDIYQNLRTLFLNGQAEYPKELLLNIIKTDKRFAKHLEYFEKLNLDEIENKIKDEFIGYYEEDEYFDLICFEWYAGNRNERNASAYVYKGEE